MPKSSYEQGICSKEGCDGFVCEQKNTHDLVCLKCGKRWTDTEWDTLVQLTREQEYNFPNVDDNLNGLNNLRM